MQFNSHNKQIKLSIRTISMKTNYQPLQQYYYLRNVVAKCLANQPEQTKNIIIIGNMASRMRMRTTPKGVLTLHYNSVLG